MRRVLVIGSSGAGKSTLAIKLGQRLGLPVIHLDAFFWQAGWKETPRDIWKQRVAELVRRECWVMDGNYGGTLEERVHAADAVVLLDFPRLQCLYRVARRAVRDRGQARPDLAQGCLEQFPDWAFLRWIWSFPTTEMPTIRQILRQHHRDKTIMVLRSASAVRRFLEALPATLHRGQTDQKRTRRVRLTRKSSRHATSVYDQVAAACGSSATLTHPRTVDPKMMYIPASFGVSDQGILDAFIRRYAFATLVTSSPGGLIASHIPIMLRRNQGKASLIGHVARANDHWRELGGSQDSLAIFHGPHAYVSPTWYATSPAVPTWNYVVVHVHGKPQVSTDPDFTRSALADLVAKYEGSRNRPWRSADLAPDFFDKLVHGIVAFEMPIEKIEGKFKLGQNRSREDRLGMLAGLESEGTSDASLLAKFIREHVEE